MEALGWNWGWRENREAMWRGEGKSVDGRKRNRLSATVPPLCVEATVPRAWGKNFIVGSWGWG